MRSGFGFVFQEKPGPIDIRGLLWRDIFHVTSPRRNGLLHSSWLFDQ